MISKRLPIAKKLTDKGATAIELSGRFGDFGAKKSLLPRNKAPVGAEELRFQSPYWDFRIGDDPNKIGY
jgi:hypothetical protein